MCIRRLTAALKNGTLKYEETIQNNSPCIYEIYVPTSGSTHNTEHMLDHLRIPLNGI